MPRPEPPSAESALPAPALGAGEAPTVARSAALVTAGIVLSRMGGLVRQKVAAHFFGDSVLADALAVAFRIANITQNLLGEGTLSSSFIPIYARLRAERRAAAASHFALSCLGLLLLVVAAISTVGALGAPWLARVLAPGFEGEKLAVTARIVRVAFPMTGILVTCAWALGVLNAHHRFFLAYAAPVLWSLAQIAGLVVFGSWFGLRGEPLALVVAWSALVGACLQLAILLPGARALLGSLRPRLDARDSSVREAARRLPGALIGRGVIQISGLVDMLLVSLLGSGANSVFGYAQTLYLLPMSLLGTGEAAAQLPAMAGATAEEDLDRRHNALRLALGASLGRIAVVAIPAAALFALLPREIVRLLLEGGSFDASATERVVPLLRVYGIALLGNAAGRVLTTTSYALGDTRTPARYAILRVLVSTAIALASLRALGVMGVVLGAVVAAWVETLALGWRLRPRIGGLGLEALKLGRIAALTASCAGTAAALRAALPTAFEVSRWGALTILASFGAAFVVVASRLGLLDLRSLARRRGAK